MPVVPVPMDEKSAAALSQPITKFIEVVAAGVGKIYEPVATIMQAGADGVASVIGAHVDVKVKEIQVVASFELSRIRLN